MKNWKTLIAGILAGLPAAIDALITAYNAGGFTDKSGTQLALGIGIVLFGAYAKDHNVTGGNTTNVPNDSSVVKETAKTDS